jgi:hypothetical protein
MLRSRELVPVSAMRQYPQMPETRKSVRAQRSLLWSILEKASPRFLCVLCASVART